MVSELQVALGGFESNRLLAVAAQVFWLVLAFTQDHPGDRYSVEFRDACERAAVEGYWVEPLPPPPPPFLFPPNSPSATANGSHQVAPCQ